MATAGSQEAVAEYLRLRFSAMREEALTEKGTKRVTKSVKECIQCYRIMKR